MSKLYVFDDTRGYKRFSQWQTNKAVEKHIMTLVKRRLTKAVYDKNTSEEEDLSYHNFDVVSFEKWGGGKTSYFIKVVIKSHGSGRRFGYNRVNFSSKANGLPDFKQIVDEVIKTAEAEKRYWQAQRNSWKTREEMEEVAKKLAKELGINYSHKVRLNATDKEGQIEVEFEGKFPIEKAREIAKLLKDF